MRVGGKCQFDITRWVFGDVIFTYLPDSAFDIVGLETTTGMTPGALLIAPK